jgi:hypothetical protein
MLNRKKEFKIDTLKFKNIESFIKDIDEQFQNGCKENRYYSISIIGKYDISREIIENLVKYNYNLSNVQIESSIIDKYDKEFIITINDTGIWCEPMWRNVSEWNKEGYIYDESNITYIHAACNSKIIPFIETKEIYEFSIDDYFEIPSDKREKREKSIDNNDDSMESKIGFVPDNENILSTEITKMIEFYDDYFPLKEIFNISKNHAEYIKNINKVLSMLNEYI